MPTSEHATFPLSYPTLSRLSLTPEFNYSDPTNARRMNALLRPSLPAFTAGELAAAGLLGRIFLHLIALYQDASPSGYQGLDHYLLSSLGQETADQGLLETIDRFPTSPTFYNPQRSQDYLLDPDSSPARRHAFYSSVILIRSADQNPVFRARDGIFTDPGLRASPAYQRLISEFQSYFKSEEPFHLQGKSLLDLLVEPFQARPDSLFDQLEYIRQRWSSLLSPDLLQDLLIGLDRLKEEYSAAGVRPGPPQDPLGFLKASYLEASDQVRFSQDQDWMPRVILLAKNVYVWLDQLSKRYQRPIFRLDQIPEEEIAALSGWGITGLWLIGLWERSPASQQIKQLCGNPDAVPSAYSLYDYSIADALGGEAGYQSLLQLTSRYGIRLAADMVPNHMGIYSRWVVDHPEWFLSLSRPPFPGYTYNGPDLSRDPQVGIFLEDHYYSKSDAAVVFKRQDNHTGDARYIYHGNDGTSMPWNDTAQLDFLNPAVREAVIQTILAVARKFPIIRFDAAMTLTKKHYQRLWFPSPGTGGAIPTRSDHSLSPEQFSKQMPHEFWRQVVDRVAQEVPDTLLLAEAFWMMEGYFVRTLGMHRVYNSAFMHMLRDEDNAKYRDLILQTLEYDPQILKRYVNFMNNPDEDTAKAQFGSDGKYFGTCALMVTLPGLPMFGHGQIEGLSEKYGMEYSRAYYDEVPDQGFIERHRREIFPLLHKRYLFAEVANFVLYDFIDRNGSLDQDVFAYSNRSGPESALVIYHNKWGDTSGRIHSSPEVRGRKTSLLSGLGLSAGDGQYLLFRDQISRMEYIRPLSALEDRGLEVNLGAYDYRVYLDFKAVQDKDGSYRSLANHLGDRGVPSLEKERQSLLLLPLGKSLAALTSATLTALSASEGLDPDRQASEAGIPESLRPLLQGYLSSASQLLPTNSEKTSAAIEESLEKRLGFISLLNPDSPFYRPIPALLAAYLADPIIEISEVQRSVLADLLALDILSGADRSQDNAGCLSDGIRIVINILPELRDLGSGLIELISFLFDQPFTRSYLNVNDYQGLSWFNQESFECLIGVALAAHSVLQAGNDDIDLGALRDLLSRQYDQAIHALAASDFQVNKYLEIIREATDHPQQL